MISLNRGKINPYEAAAHAVDLGAEVPTVDLHGESIHVALSLLDDALHHAFMEGASAVRIIHGRGSGVLRQAIQKHLRTLTAFVAFYRNAEAPGQEDGVTIAVLHHRT